MINEFTYNDVTYCVGDLYKEKYNSPYVYRLTKIEPITVWDGTDSRYICHFENILWLSDPLRNAHSTHILDNIVPCTPNELLELRMKIDTLLRSEAQRYADIEKKR